MEHNPSPLFDLNEVIEQVDYGVNIIDQEFNILYMNNSARNSLSVVHSEGTSFKCHKLLFGHDTPCPRCPVLEMKEQGTSTGQIVGPLKVAGNPNYRVRYHQLAGNLHAQTLTDISKETDLVRQVTLQSKETQAQNIILKRKRETLEEEHAFLMAIFNSIQSGILVLDSAEDLQITITNKAMRNFLNEEEHQLLKKKCYQLFGYQRRCPGCPITIINSQTNFSRMRYHQKLKEVTLTEYYTRLAGNKILLTFEDSTRRVLMVQEIKENKEMIERQNQIFRSLLETGTRIQQTKEIDDLFSHTLEQLHHLFFNIGFGIILNGERPQIIEGAVFKDILPEEQSIIIEHNVKLLEPGISKNLVDRIHSYYASLPGGSLPNPSHWTILPVMGSHSRVIGKFLIKGPSLEQHDLEIITLFLEQVAAVAENQLLTKQLEVMANTDPLTGSYNRGYFTKELDSAMQNATRFSIAFSILLVDVNGLKRVNDIFGHEAGDDMITTVAKLLKEACRKTDIVTRLGGDEFVVLCPATDSMQVKNLLTRIREKEVQTSMTCYHPDRTEDVIPIRMSIGWASSENTPPDEVLKLADQAMYIDKELFYANKERYR